MRMEDDIGDDIGGNCDAVDGNNQRWQISKFDWCSRVFRHILPKYQNAEEEDCDDDDDDDDDEEEEEGG